MIDRNSRLGAYIGPALFLFALILRAGTAHADRIDGDWCSLSGQRLSIDGTNIVTPAGTMLLGIYERHNFSYIIPVPEIHAGARIEMSLQNEQTMLLRRYADSSDTVQVETWKRCEATS